MLAQKVRPGVPACRSIHAGPACLPILCPRASSVCHQGSGRPTSIQDFGHPADPTASTGAVFDGKLPSSKKTKEAISSEVSAFKKGPGMHDSGGLKSVLK